MRDDTLGLRPIAEMQGGAGRAEIETGDGDGCKSIRDRNARVVVLRVMQAVNRQVTGLASMMAHGASIGMMTYTGRARDGLGIEAGDGDG